MVDLSTYKKADLLDVAHKIGLTTTTKDTKKTLIEKIESYISEAGAEGEQLVEASLEIESEDDAATLAEKDDSEDKEYTRPPIDVLKFFDPVVQFTEEKYQKLLEFTDSIGVTTLEYNDELRENLSTTVTLNYLELILEFSYFLYTYLPWVALKDNSTVHPLIKEYVPYVSSLSFPVPDLTYLFTYKTLSIALNWTFFAVLTPLFLSYYFNFTRRTILVDDETSVILRIYKFDPFIFALFKLLIFFFITYNAGTLVTLNSYCGILKALEKHFLIQLGFYKEFNLLLGNFPLVLGLANVAIGIYAQFEDF